MGRIMKIAFILDVFPKLSESFVTNQITGLLDMGHDVRIFSSNRPNETQTPQDFDKYDLASRTHYAEPVPANKTCCRIKTVLLILKYIFISPTKTFHMIKQICQCPKDFNYRTLYMALSFPYDGFEIIHCHFGPAGNRGAFFKQTGAKGKLVVTFHGYDVATYVRTWGKDVYRNLFAVGDMFTYNSKATYKKLVELGCPDEKMKKLPMGVHLDRIDFIPRTPAPDGKINILSVGRLVEMKGRRYAIEAVAKVVAKWPGLTYNIVGDGSEMNSLQSLINELGVGETVKLLGWVSDEKLECLYDSAHILLHPSVTAKDGNQEGQGVVLVEAQAAGMPVIATIHGAFPETVKDGITGFLVGEKDVDALAEKLDYLISNPQLWLEIGQQGRGYAEEKYDIRKLNCQLEEMYKEVIS
jgi:colanic acid/amylovoran biosynthesis glycosyltransferase